MEEDSVGAEDDVLSHHVFVAFQHGIWRPAVPIDLSHLCPVDRDTVRFAAFRPRLWRAPFLCRGVVLGGRGRRVRLDGGLALLSLEPVEFVAQTLDVRLGRPPVGHDVFQQGAQLPDEFACPIIRDAVQGKVFKHTASGSSGERLRISRAIMPAISYCSNPQGHELSAPDY